MSNNCVLYKQQLYVPPQLSLLMITGYSEWYMLEPSSCRKSYVLALSACDHGDFSLQQLQHLHGRVALYTCSYMLCSLLHKETPYSGMTRGEALHCTIGCAAWHVSVNSCRWCNHGKHAYHACASVDCCIPYPECPSCLLQSDSWCPGASALAVSIPHFWADPSLLSRRSFQLRSQF